MYWADPNGADAINSNGGLTSNSGAIYWGQAGSEQNKTASRNDKSNTENGDKDSTINHIVVTSFENASTGNISDPEEDYKKYLDNEKTRSKLQIGINALGNFTTSGQRYKTLKASLEAAIEEWHKLTRDKFSVSDFENLLSEVENIALGLGILVTDTEPRIKTAATAIQLALYEKSFRLYMENEIILKPRIKRADEEYYYRKFPHERPPDSKSGGGFSGGGAGKSGGSNSSW